MSRSFYKASIEMPSGLCTSLAAYLLLSESYRDDGRRASAFGWPVEQLGTHLHIVNDEESIASVLRDLAHCP